MRTPHGPSSVNFELPSPTTTTPRAQLRPCCSPTPPKTRSQHLRKTISTTMLFFSFFKTLVEHEITVELKNEVQIRGTLKSVDQYLNIKLDNAEAVDEMRWPHLCSTKDMFIRGSVVRYVHLPSGAVDTALLEDATRREAEAAKNKAK
ncbi:U6 snRNA-associated Sm-like protein LSm2 [Parastagonospora nodorum]|nr:U6 snRNA-associated Sm-like protein LSm2 [Parastagonospora nodorum]KAH3966795.1 U6 snRNA-associated Sm-like protein LSm2 [Parastagonospora nodorum]KAH4018203.1 U6 snRNA-associated Sm-like protein LSm2 [Parastagonospora nodorum]KAH4115167.1 U6 snRNA-associated Sm-like protein LSm2 [Parastagonospora nodorum]KAH4184394.1 U6 snRNA-associated Sm-like protein LSm2 [Parastagonospora nodorum]